LLLADKGGPSVASTPAAPAMSGHLQGTQNYQQYPLVKWVYTPRFIDGQLQGKVTTEGDLAAAILSTNHFYPWFLSTTYLATQPEHQGHSGQGLAWTEPVPLR